MQISTRSALLAAFCTLVLTGCDPAQPADTEANVAATEPPMSPGPVAATTPADERAANCATYLILQREAVKAGAPGDVLALQAAANAWRADLERQMGKPAADQYVASNLAVFDTTPPDAVRAAADQCLTTAPQMVATP